MKHTYLVVLALGVVSCISKPKEVISEYQPYKAFAITVEETVWNGKLEPGRYTKSGIKIIKQ